jgi:hypothetical protein
MKNFLAVLSLIWLLGSCTYNNYIFKKDEFIKDFKNNEVKMTDVNVKNNRNDLIQYCQKDGDSTCYFLKKDGVEYMGMLLKNESVLNFYNEKIINIRDAFCRDSNILHISAKFHIALTDAKLARNFDCITSTWDEWYLTEKQNKDRY